VHEDDNFELMALLPLLYLLVLLYCVAAAILLPFGLPLFRDGEMSSVLCAAGAIAVCVAALYLVRQSPRRVLSPAVAKAASFSASVIILSCSSYIATVAYFAIKPAIPLINRHHYDQVLTEVQQKLFDGISPSLWLIHQASGHELQFFDASYNMFMPFLAVSLMIAVYAKGLRGGVHLSIAQFIGLFVGLIIALIFPTNGPIFEHPATFLPKLADTLSGHLAQDLVASARVYHHDPLRAPLLAGIAAMPSYHVFSWACGLLYWRYLPRWVLAIGVLACALDWLSTVALGWHYALDGVVSLLLVYPAWKMSNGFIRLATPDSKRFPARPMDLPEPLPAAASGPGR
jgi:hypothetical protein